MKGRPELFLPGAMSLSVAQIQRVIAAAVAVLAQAGAATCAIDVGGIGAFRPTPAHSSWIQRTLLAALDYYDGDEVEALQISPVGGDMLTIDVPNASREYRGLTSRPSRLESCPSRRFSVSTPQLNR